MRFFTEKLFRWKDTVSGKIIAGYLYLRVAGKSSRMECTYFDERDIITAAIAVSIRIFMKLGERR